MGDRRKFGDQGTNLRNFWEKSNIRLRLISELMEKSKSQPSSKYPPQYWTPNHEVQKPTFNTNFAKFYKENYKSYSRKMYFMDIFLKTSIKVWLWNISDKTLLLKFGFMNTAMWSPKPNSEPNFWPKRTTEFNRGQNSGAAHLYSQAYNKGGMTLLSVTHQSCAETSLESNCQIPLSLSDLTVAF